MECAATLRQAHSLRANVFLTNHAAWVGGPLPEVLNRYRDSGLLCAAISHDEPYRFDGYDRQAALQAPGYDLWFTNWGEESFLANHPAREVVYLPCAARQEFVPVPATVPEQHAVGFLGVYYPAREDYLRAVLDLGLVAYMIPRMAPPFHEWPPPPDLYAAVPPGARYLPPEAVANFIRSSRVSLDLCEQPDGRVRGAKNRLFEATALGSPTVTGDCAQVREFFVPGEHVRVYRTPEECRAECERLLSEPEEAQAMARRASRLVLSRHLWLHRVAEVSRRMDRKLGGAVGDRLGVVIPTCNRGPWTARAAWSVAGCETVLVNTGDDLLPSGPWRVLNAPGAGASRARNLGEAALSDRVEWVLFLDDDDCMRAGWEGVLAQALDDPEATAEVYTWGAFSTDSRHPGILSAFQPFTSQMLWRRQSFRATGGFETELALAEEQALLRTILANGGRQVALENVLVYKGGEDERRRVQVRQAPGYVPHERKPAKLDRWRRF